jgi:hypothetical protein
LEREQAKLVQRVRMYWIRGKHLPIDLLGFLQTSRLVQPGPLRQYLVDVAHEGAIFARIAAADNRWQSSSTAM